MKSKLIQSIGCLAIAGLMMAAGTQKASASSQRLESMGMKSGNYWMIDFDLIYVVNNPTMVNIAQDIKFLGLVSGSYNTTFNDYVHLYLALFRPVQGLSIATYSGLTAPSDSISAGMASPFNMHYNSLVTGANLNAADITTLDDALVEDAGIAFGYQINQGISVGMRIAYGSNEDKNKNSTAGTQVDLKESFYVLNLGSMIFLSKSLGFDIAASFTGLNMDYRDNVTAAPANITTKDDGAYITSFNVRGLIATAETNRVIPYVKFEYSSLPTKVTGTASPLNPAAIAKYDRSGYSLTVGLSDNFRPIEGMLAYVGTQFDLKSKSFDDNAGTEMTQTDMEIPICTGIEAPLTDSFTLRAGARYFALQSRKVKTESAAANTETFNTYDPYIDSKWDFNLGFVYKKAGWAFEFQINRDLLAEGPYVLSGNNITSNGGNIALGWLISYAVK